MKFEVDLIITDMSIGSLQGTPKFKKSHFTLISQKELTKEKVIANVVYTIKWINLAILDGENITGNRS